MHVFDGTVRAPGAARWRSAEAVYQRCRSAALARIVVETPFDFEIDARIEDGHLKGTVTAHGPDEEGLGIQVVLAEKGVLFPGKSTVVVHRAVARAALTGADEGVAFQPVDGTMELTFDASFDALAEAQESYLDQLEAEGLGSVARISTRIDPRQARVVVFAFDRTDGSVLGAALAEPALPEDLR